MSCSGIRYRNKGSGYVKPSSETAEMNTKLEELLAARNAQDTRMGKLNLTEPNLSPLTQNECTTMTQSPSLPSKSQSTR